MKLCGTEVFAEWHTYFLFFTGRKKRPHNQCFFFPTNFDLFSTRRKFSLPEKNKSSILWIWLESQLWYVSILNTYMRIYTVLYAPREHPLVASNFLTRVRFPIGREPNSCQSPFGSSGCVKSNGAILSRGRPPGWFRQVSPDEFIQTSVDAGLWLMEWWDGETQTIGEHLYRTWQVGCQNVTVSDWDTVVAGGKGAWMDEKWSQDFGRWWMDSW
jgi:hypothetical protein